MSQGRKKRSPFPCLRLWYLDGLGPCSPRGRQRYGPTPGQHHAGQELLLDGGDPRLHGLQLGLQHQHQGPPACRSACSWALCAAWGVRRVFVPFFLV